MRGGNDAWSRSTADQRRDPSTTTTLSQQYNHGTPQPQQQQYGGGNSVVMDFETAQLDKHQYDDGKPETWHHHIHAYTTGRDVDVKPYLKWIESCGNRNIDFEDLEAMTRVDGVMVDFVSIQCASKMWSWLSSKFKSCPTNIP